LMMLLASKAAAAGGRSPIALTGAGAAMAAGNGLASITSPAIANAEQAVLLMRMTYPSEIPVGIFAARGHESRQRARRPSTHGRPGKAVMFPYNGPGQPVQGGQRKLQPFVVVARRYRWALAGIGSRGPAPNWRSW
jgi:hypothetical protein